MLLSRADPLKKMRVCEGGALTCVSCSPDGTRLAVAADNALVQVWDLGLQQCLCTYRGHRNVVSSLCWSSDARFLASASWDGSVQVWDALTAECECCYYGHRRASSSSRVLAVAWSPDGSYLASSATDWTIRVWRAGTMAPLQTLSDHLGGISCLAWASDGQHVLSAGQDALVRIWDAVLFPRPLLSYGQHRSGLVAAAWAPDRQAIVSLESAGHLHMWSLRPSVQTIWTQVLTCEDEEEDLPGAVAYAPSGSFLASARGNVVILHDACTGQRLKELHGHTDCVSSLSFVPGSSLLVTSSWDATLSVWTL